MKNYIIGIYIGGSYIKSGIVKYDGEIVASMKIPTPMSVGVGSMENVFKTIAARLTEQAGITKENIIGVGVGSAGAVDSSLGEVCFAANLTMERFPLASVAEEALGLPVKVANDANCACLGEWKFGSGKNFSDMILVTLGTGVGGGIIVDNKLLTGNRGAGGEIGHMLLCKGGRQCSCGRKGCFEAYVSGGALVNMNGEVIGINSAKLASTEVEGMGYAIPISRVSDIIETLMNETTRTKVSESEKSSIGITGITVNETITQAYDIPAGVYVAEVTKGSGAEQAGIRQGDVIIAFDGKEITDIQQLQDVLLYYSAGETVEVSLKTMGDGGYVDKTVSLTLGHAADTQQEETQDNSSDVLRGYNAR